jgi:hypothetical protein
MISALDEQRGSLATTTAGGAPAGEARFVLRIKGSAPTRSGNLTEKYTARCRMADRSETGRMSCPQRGVPFNRPI